MRRGSLFVILSAVMALVLVIIAVLLYFGYQTVNAASVAVNFAPQTHVISQVVNLKADPNATSNNSSTATIRAHLATFSTTQQQTGNTTGQVECTFFFGCKQGVDVADVTNLVNQMLPGMKQSLTQKLQGKMSEVHGIEIGPVNFSDPVINSSPQIGATGQNVTVTVTEQGSVGYFLTTDETNAVNASLNSALTSFGAGYQLVNSTINIGHAVTKSVDPTSGISRIAVPAGAVARYQFTPAQLQAISSGLVGKSLSDAQTFLKKQAGIDPASISIHFTTGSGSSMPGDIQHIKLQPLAGGTLPGVQLTPVSGFTPTPSSTSNGN